MLILTIGNIADMKNTVKTALGKKNYRHANMQIIKPFLPLCFG